MNKREQNNVEQIHHFNNHQKKPTESKYMKSSKLEVC